MEAIHSSETSVYPTSTQPHNPEGNILQYNLSIRSHSKYSRYPSVLREIQYVHLADVCSSYDRGVSNTATALWAQTQLMDWTRRPQNLRWSVAAVTVLCGSSAWPPRDISRSKNHNSLASGFHRVEPTKYVIMRCVRSWRLIYHGEETGECSHIRFSCPTIVNINSVINGSTMELSHSWEAASCAATEEFHRHFMEPEGSLTFSKETSNDHYSEPDQSTKYYTILS
jgi:hypothetical protein